jgi:hypothetical protein
MEGFDFEERSKWDPTCLKLDLLSREGNNNNLHLWVVDFPWPMSDREYLLRTRLERYEGGSAASITRIVKNSESILAKEPENVRIEDFTQSATARPLQVCLVFSNLGLVFRIWCTGCSLICDGQTSPGRQGVGWGWG